ncbi:MAG: response regulator transcription factor [Actinobacteria bacterium]|nr:response regulator transcription factor [Actinomycetota bacterium]
MSITAECGTLTTVTDTDVLLVEDAPEYIRLETDVLSDAGYNVRSVTTVADALVAMTAAMPDVVVLDLGLPDGDGLDLCRSIREHSNAYVIVVSGRAREVDKLRGFRLGADDFLMKPFSGRELVARVEALLRRPRTGQAEGLPRVFGELVLDPHSREVTVAGAPVDLTRIEFDLLETMSANPRRVFTRQQLLDKVWGQNWFGDDHVVDVHVANLRKKIDAGAEKSWVRTVRGVGYSMAL